MQTLQITNPPDVRISGEAVPVPKAKIPVRADEITVEKTKFDEQEVAKLQTALAEHDIALKFSRDETTHNIVVQMIDQKTGEAIRQFPTEVSLSLAATFQKLQGVFVDVVK